MHSAKGPSQRQLRIGELIRKALAEIFIRIDIRDQDLTGVVWTVSEVSLSPDAKNALVFVFPLGGGDPEIAVAALNRHAKFLRGEVTRKVSLKHTPQLKFQIDNSFDYSERIDQVLKSDEVSKDLD